MLRFMRCTRLRSLIVVLVALLLASGPALNALSSAQAANPHAGMVMGDAGNDSGCCDHSTPDDTSACAAHCAAGAIVASMAFAPSEAVSTPVAAAFVLPDASHAPVPDTAPPKPATA